MVDPKTLAALPLFAGLERDGLSTLADRARERSFRPGQLLFSAGSQPAGLLVILEGRVRVVRGRDARQQVIHDEGPGGALGEIPVFGGGTYPATAVAAEPTRCVLILTDALLGIAGRNPDLALAFVRRLGERTRQLVTRMADLAVEPVSRRLIRLILERSNHAGAETPIALGQNQTELAEELGTVREVVVRKLRELRTAGLIQSHGQGKYSVSDRQGLLRLLSHSGTGA
jgi:CRP-like cAMP-binding protein